jgi:transcription antitermination factor NusG
MPHHVVSVANGPRRSRGARAKPSGIASLSGPFDVERSGLRWFVARVATGGELAAVALLAEHGLAAPAPLREVRVRKSRRRGGCWRRTALLLPGYLLLGVPGAPWAGRWRRLRAEEVLALDWSRVHGARAVSAVLGEAAPHELDPAEVARLAALSADLDAAVRAARVRETIAPGAPVRVLGGPLAGFSGTLDAIGDGEAGDVLVSLFGREVCASVSLAGLAAVHGA